MKRAILTILMLAGLALPASAFAPRTEQMERVREVASELETTARSIADDAWSNRRVESARQDAALRRMDELASRATYFRRQVGANRANPEATVDDFQALVAAYTSASASINEIHPAGSIPADFRRLERMMNELTDYYGGQERYWGAYGNDRPNNATIAAGSVLAVNLDNAIRSRDLENGQELRARLSHDVSIGGRVVGRAGELAMVRVVEMDRAGRVKGRERLVLELSQVRLNGRDYPVDSEQVTFEANDSKERDAGTIAGGAVLGAIIGAITDGGDGAAKGAAVGGAAGTGVVLSTRGKSVKLPAGQQIEFRLADPVRVRMPRPGEERRHDDTAPGDISRRRF